ncbi:MAG: hypothetical protein H0V17_12760 [Deltaproteobacteria bacterium]|nr:hypothetical protein [Deltaproteobacteria bacterium]
MRLAAIALTLTACFTSASELSAVGDDDADPAPGGVPNGLCRTDDECVPAGATCCDCPTFARSIFDPQSEACEAVGCDNDPSVCPTNVEAACDQASGSCVLACAPLQCLECPNGYFTEANGCLSCTCAPPVSQSPDCGVDSDCSRVRADCCGCQNGGEDTAVATADAAAFDQALSCNSGSQCPGQGNSSSDCDAELAPRCVNGACELIAEDMPAEACGRPDLPACAPGKICTINVDPAASLYGVGTCQ